MALTIKGGKSPPRNSLCPCGSKLKYKCCHGDILKQSVCSRVANEKMVQLIREEQKKKGIISRNYKCNNCGFDFDEPTCTITVPDEKICPQCRSLNIEKIGGE